MDKKKLILSFFSVAVKFLLFLLFVEFLLQLISYGKYLYVYQQMIEKYSQRKAFEIYPELKTAQAYWPKTVGYADPFLGWVYGIKEDNDQTLLTIRPTLNNPEVIDDGIKKIFIFGGSTIWGAFTTDQNTIPSLLAGQLNNQKPRFNIVNHGQLTYTTNQEIIKLMLELKNNNIPDYVIFYDGCNDYLTAPSRVFQEDYFIEQIGDIDNFLWRKPTKNYSLIRFEEFISLIKDPRYIKLYYYPQQIYKRILALIKNEPLIKEIGTDHEEKKQYILNNYAANAALIDKLANAYEFKYLLLWQPLANNKQLTSQEIELVPMDEQYIKDAENYKQITNALKAKNISNFVDLTEAFAEFPDKSVFIDQCHLTAEGNAIMANEIFETISNYEWIH